MTIENPIAPLLPPKLSLAPIIADRMRTARKRWRPLAALLTLLVSTGPVFRNSSPALPTEPLHPAPAALAYSSAPRSSPPQVLLAAPCASPLDAARGGSPKDRSPLHHIAGCSWVRTSARLLAGTSGTVAAGTAAALRSSREKCTGDAGRWVGCVGLLPLRMAGGGDGWEAAGAGERSY